MHPSPGPPHTPSGASEQLRHCCLQASMTHRGGKLRHGGQGRPLEERPEATECLERCWLMLVPLSHVRMPPRAWEEKRGHVQRWAPLGPGGLCGVMGLCLSTLNVPWISGDPGKDPFGGCAEHTVGPQLHGMMGGLSIPIRLPPCLFQPWHAALLRHPHAAVSEPQGCTSVPAAPPAAPG